MDNMSALVQVMAWHWTGSEPITDPMRTQIYNTHDAINYLIDPWEMQLLTLN